MVGSRLLQTNKKWSHLKQSQRIWIFDVTKEEITAYIAAQGHLPGKSGRQTILDKVHDRILGREIWLPYGDMKMHVCKFIAKTVRKHTKLDSDAKTIVVETEIVSNIKEVANETACQE